MNAGYAMVVKIVNARMLRPQPAARTHLGEAITQLAQEAVRIVAGAARVRIGIRNAADTR